MNGKQQVLNNGQTGLGDTLSTRTDKVKECLPQNERLSFVDFQAKFTGSNPVTRPKVSEEDRKAWVGNYVSESSGVTWVS